MFDAKKSFAGAEPRRRPHARQPEFPPQGFAGAAGRSRRHRFHSTAKHGYPLAYRKNSRNGLARRHRRPLRSNRRRRSRSLLGKARGNGGARRYCRRARESARICQDPDCARRSEGFLPRRTFGKKVPQGVNAGVVERSFEFAGRFLRQFTQNHVECIARAPCRRNNGKIENETGCAKIGAHSRRVGAALRRQSPFRVAFGCASTGFGMANKEEPWHRAK